MKLFNVFLICLRQIRFPAIKSRNRVVATVNLTGCNKRVNIITQADFLQHIQPTPEQWTPPVWIIMPPGHKLK